MTGTYMPRLCSKCSEPATLFLAGTSGLEDATGFCRMHAPPMNWPAPDLTSENDQLRTDLAAAVGERDALAKMLRPFAKIAPAYPVAKFDDSYLLAVREDGAKYREITVGDCRRAAAAYRSAGERDAWQPIETSPRDGRFIFLWVNEGPDTEDCLRIGFYSEQAKAFDCPDAGWLTDPRPTHWMPLPAPPAAALRPAGEQAKGGGS